MKNRGFYGVLAVGTLSLALVAADDIWFCLGMLAACAFCLQKAGVVNWIEEIKKED